MPGNVFSYPAWDLTTMTQLDSLPYQGVSFGEPINQPGPWSGGLPLADPRVQAANWRDSSRTGRTLLCVELANVLVWGGIVWTRDYDNSSQLLKVGASQIGSYFAQRLQAADYTTTWSTPADPMVVAQRIVTDALAVTGGSIAGGVTLTLNPAGGSGQTIAASYPATQLQTIDSIVSTLSQMGYTLGFDYSFDVAYLPGTKTPGVTMNLWYPRKGRTAAQSGLVILAKDLIGFTYPEDSTRQYTSITETGSGSGGLQPVTVSESLPGYPLLEAAISRSQVNDEGVLANIAFGDLGLYAYPVTTPTVTFPVPVPDSSGVTDPGRIGFGQFTAGDSLIWRIDPVAGAGENTNPRFPAGMNFEWRINQWTCTPEDKGVSTLRFDLGVPPVNVIPPPQPPL